VDICNTNHYHYDHSFYFNSNVLWGILLAGFQIENAGRA
jgi:predicted metallo-beta-lactamase superfamily hydrolase